MSSLFNAMFFRRLLTISMIWAFALITLGAASQPVLSDLRRVTWVDGAWYAALGTSLYTSKDGRNWSERAELPDRANALAGGEGRLLVAGRDYVAELSTDQPTGIKVHELKGDWVSLCGDGPVWAAVDSRGRISSAAAKDEIITLGEGLRMSDLECSEGGSWWAVGSKDGQGVVFNAPIPEGPWRMVTATTLPPLLHVIIHNGSPILLSASGTAFEPGPFDGWLEIGTFGRLGNETPLEAVATAKDGLVVLMRDGIVRSLDGQAWARATYHEDEYQARSVVAVDGGACLVRLSPDNPESGLRITPISTLQVPIPLPIVKRPGVPPTLVSKLIDWDRNLAMAADKVTRSAASTLFLRATAEEMKAMPEVERTAWFQRISRRLPPTLLRQLSAAPGTDSPDALETEEEEMHIHPPLFDFDLMRQRAANGSPGARLDLAVAYLHGAGVRSDRSAAEFWLGWAHDDVPTFPTLDQLELHAASLEQLRELASHGSTWAQVLLGDHHREGGLVEMDFSEAAKWYRQAAALGNYDAMTTLGELHLLGWGVERNAAAALALFSEPARSNHPLALYNFGRCFELGAAVVRDRDRALHYYAQSGEMGEPRSLRKLADYSIKKGDTEEARRLLGHAAEAGDREAARRIEALDQGSYVPAEVESYSRSTLRAAAFDLEARIAQARQGDGAACYDVSWAASTGSGMYPNTRYAMWWLERATKAGIRVPAEDDVPGWISLAEAGSLVAQANVAEFLLAGQHVPENPGRARRYFLQAAQGGHFSAQGRLGILLREGVGGPANREEGLQWLEKAAANGDPAASYELASALSTGDGVDLNLARSLELFRKAAAGGVRRAQLDLAFLIASEQVKAPKDEASAWYLALAGLEPVTCPPETAAARILELARQGNGSAQAVWAVLLRIGFGTPVDTVEATAWSLLAETQDANFYALSWYSENGDAPRAAERAAELKREIAAKTVPSGTGG